MNLRPRGENKERRKKFDKIHRRAEEIIEEMSVFDYDEFKRRLTGKEAIKKGTVQEYFEKKISETDKVSTGKVYRSVLNSLEDFDKNITFQKITPKYLKAYEGWFISKGGSITSIGIYMRHFKAIINRAGKDGLIKSYPFGVDNGKYRIPKSSETKKALSKKEVGMLFDYRTNDWNEYLAKQYWFFSYLCHGMNMVDIANLKFKNIQDNHLKFIRQKTKDTAAHKKEIVVILSDDIWDIINKIGNEIRDPEKYIFPILKQGMSSEQIHAKVQQHTKNTNKYLKRIAEKLGVNNKLTMYWARHSYSTILLRDGAPIEFISEQLGHADIKTTQNYLDGFEDEQKKKFSACLLNFDK